MAHYILADGGRPFTDHDAATVKGTLLAAELGPSMQIEVVPHPEGGYAVRCERRDRPADERTKPETPVSNIQATASAQYPERFNLAPAARAFVTQHILGGIGLILVLQPHLFFKAIGMQLPQGKVGVIALTAVFCGGAVIALISLVRFLWVYVSNAYVIDETGVQQIQWYWDRARLRRRAPRLNFSNLRAVDIEQTITQMMLGVGTLKLASGGTYTYEVQLRMVRSPKKLQAEFQRRMTAPVRPAPNITRAALV